MSPLTEAVLATAENGGSVRVALNGRKIQSIRMVLRATAGRHGLKACVHRESDNSAIAWCEKDEAHRTL